MKRIHILPGLLIILFHLFIFRGVSYGDVPTVTIDSGPDNIDHTNGTADFTGNVTDLGGLTVTSKGMCWGLTHDPTIDANNHTSDGVATATGTFDSTITGLMPGQTYYVRAYGTNSDGTGYSGEVSVSIDSTRPQVTTLPVTGIASTSATCGGNVDSEGGEPVTAKGICWSTSLSPDLDDNVTVNGTGRGAFSVEITGLTPATGYYVRAYATNALGTRYGDNVNFTTLSTPALPVVETEPVSGITTTGAVCGGYIKDEGETPVTARGVCWGTTSPPDIADDLYTENGTGDGRFTSTITGLTTGVTYYIRAYAVNTNGTGYGEVETFIPDDYAPQISAAPQELYFKKVISGVVTPEQQFLITNTGHKDSALAWTIDYSATWFEATPAVGTGSGIVHVSYDPTGLELGDNIGFITITDPEASNSPYTVTINLEIAEAGDDSIPIGALETPADGAVVSGSVPVTGWAVDDVAVKHVKIYRDPFPGEGLDMVYIGDAIFVQGARPDIEDTYPGYPNNSRAGWGYMLLTHALPYGGNGTYVLHAVADDMAGNQVLLGTKTITCDNANAVKPFGTIDSPMPGETVSGSQFLTGGWALTPYPNGIPTDGSTIHVMVNGIPVGNPVYDQERPDIAGLFPGYVNSNGAGGSLYLDTTQYNDGVHTISWSVTDNADNSDGIGSRYFTIVNTNPAERRAGTSAAAPKRKSRTPTVPLTFRNLPDIPRHPSTPLTVKKGYPRHRVETVTAGENGVFHIKTRALERLEIPLGFGNKFYRVSGYIAAGERLRPLPTGSTLSQPTGTFIWQPGPGFFGAYPIVFIARGANGEMSRKSIIINVN